MNSCLYSATVMHHRLGPKPHRFHYRVFMFYIDLDELETLAARFLLFSRNAFNLFSFRDGEHLQLPAEAPDRSKSTKEHIVAYLRENGITEPPHRIMLLTNLNVLGYNFNPVSFYFCFNRAGEAICSVAEVSNTFREMKPYFLGQAHLSKSSFHLNTTKYFYVSPFFDADMNFDFHLDVPGEKLKIRIDTFKQEERRFIATLTGHRKELSGSRLLWLGIRFPLIPLRIITLIHWNALLLWIKKLPFHKKSENKHLQKGVYRKYVEK